MHYVRIIISLPCLRVTFYYVVSANVVNGKYTRLHIRLLCTLGLQQCSVVALLLSLICVQQSPVDESTIPTIMKLNTNIHNVVFPLNKHTQTPHQDLHTCICNTPIGCTIPKHCHHTHCIKISYNSQNHNYVHHSVSVVTKCMLHSSCGESGLYSAVCPAS